MAAPYFKSSFSKQDTLLAPEGHELNNISPVDQAFLSPNAATSYFDIRSTDSHSLNEPFLAQANTFSDRLPHQPPSVLRFSAFYSHWRYETLSLIASIAAVVAIVVVLCYFDGKPVPDWPVGITLNALVSVLSTISKAAMIAAVASCISQLKWMWFGQSRPLRDFELFDDASRGPWGALQLIVRKHSIHLVGLGAIITVVALLVDPFIQQIIAYTPQNTSSNIGTVARAQMYDGGRSSLECKCSHGWEHRLSQLAD
jgi:hypothetical protein